MIIVLDTNVLISALLSPQGVPAKVMNRWEAEEFDVAVSPSLLVELERVLHYPRIRERFQEPQEKINLFLKRLKRVSIHVRPDFRLDVIKDDPDDNRILECALTANASYIISGDDHLLSLERYRGIEILPPVGFLALLELH
ncbi:MAG: hypothetical protein MAG431_01560 [Chloroflexi bacterium]|nr:hypothetical protein [Chloroflexota bacterium]